MINLQKMKTALTPLKNLLKDNTLRPDTITEINDRYRRAMRQLFVKNQQMDIANPKNIFILEVSN